MPGPVHRTPLRGLDARGTRQLERLVRDLLRGWNATRETAPIVPSHDEVVRLAPQFRRPLPWGPEPVARMRADLQALLALSRRNDSPRFWGYVAPAGSDAGALGDWLASGINQNLTAFRSAPGATLVEFQVIEWIREMVGLPRSAFGILTSGGSIANLAGLAAARDAAVPFDLAKRGLRGEPGAPLVLYASDEVHDAVLKAASILGIGRDFVRLIPADRRLRLDVAALRGALARDRRAHLLPFAVVASAGTVTTGAVDPLRDIGRLCRRERLWMHVDACYGGFAILAPSARRLLRGLAFADSIALDPHKWMSAPVDAGCILYRRPEAARRAFRQEADYTRVFGTERLERFAFWDYGPELSRRFRALKIWMMLKHHGASVFAEAIEENLRMARRLEAKVRGTRRLELLNRSDLGIVCFRYVPPGPRLPEADLTRLNERVMVAIQRRGRAFVSNARVRGRFALRACIINYRTSEADLDALIAETLAAGAAVGVSDASDRVAASAGATVSTRSGRGRGSRGRRPSRPRSRSGAGRSR
jgi:glutamate/tyrosine decarboxylase-like PLP-dependent enzyme